MACPFIRGILHGFFDEAFELAICRQAIIEFKPEAPGRFFRLGHAALSKTKQVAFIKIYNTRVVSAACG